MNERPLPNKILLFVYPLMYLLMLMGLGGYAVLYLMERPSALFLVGVFSAYLLYRFVNRARILIREMFWPGDVEDEEPDDGPS